MVLEWITGPHLMGIQAAHWAPRRAFALTIQWHGGLPTWRFLLRQYGAMLFPPVMGEPEVLHMSKGQCFSGVVNMTKMTMVSQKVH